MNDVKKINKAIKIFNSQYNFVISEITDVISPQTRHKLICNSRDIVTSVNIFINQYTNYLELNKKKNLSQESLKKILKLCDETDYILIILKSFFFFVRSFHDNVYRALLEINGQNSGNASMSNGLKNKNPVNNKIIEIRGYKEWFFKFRNIRNDIKYGVSNGAKITVTQGNYKIFFNFCSYVGDYVQTKNQTTIDDLIEIIKISTKILDVLYINKKKEN